LRRLSAGKCEGRMKVLAIQNFEVEGIGLHEEYLRERKIYLDTIHPYRGDLFPSDEGFDLVIVGGTPVCVREIDSHPFLLEERSYLTERIEGGGSCLGICFGSQLLASLLGAGVKRNPVREIGGYEVRLTPEGKTDPLLAGFPDTFPVFHWHGDTFDIPEGALHLAEGDNCQNQLFRRGNVIGVQFHIEITTPMAARWTVEYADELPETGKSAEQVVQECRVHESEMRELTWLFMDNLFSVLSED
jgi:GMP synthase (glutamine-hydrolysing)